MKPGVSGWAGSLQPYEGQQHLPSDRGDSPIAFYFSRQLLLFYGVICSVVLALRLLDGLLGVTAGIQHRAPSPRQHAVEAYHLHAQ